MGASKVEGKNVVLKASTGAGFYGIYCAQSVAINFTVEQLPSTSIQGGEFKEFLPGFISWDVSLSGVTFVKDDADNNWSAFDFSDPLLLRSGLTLQLAFENSNGSAETFTGKANIASNNIGGTAGQLSKFDIKFQGCGAYTMSFVGPTNNEFSSEFSGEFN